VREGIAQTLAAARLAGARSEDLILPVVYDELRKLAEFRLSHERPGQTLTATALVHEAYLKLVDGNLDWQDRRSFFNAASRAMREILVDRARAKGSKKRGGDRGRVQLTETSVPIVTATPPTSSRATSWLMRRASPRSLTSAWLAQPLRIRL
jgi:RNA polymerase sigma factor (TIGR02999 family)